MTTTTTPAFGSLPRAAALDAGEDAPLVWRDVCHVDDLLPDAGAPALFGELQIAVVRVSGREGPDSFFALDNFDPFSRAPVIARGIVGDKNGVPKIASPIFKQTFDLRTGQCFEDPEVRLRTYPVRVREGRVELGFAPGRK